MKLTRLFERQGNWLFTWRSYLPLTLLPLLALALPHAENLNSQVGDTVALVYRTLCFLIGFSGLTIRAIAATQVRRGTSGQNTKKQVADSLNRDGIYSVVRHPLYLGNFLVFEGMMLYTGVWWLVALTILLFILYYERIMVAEEAFLQQKFGAEFDEWVKQTPSFFPNFKLWQPPSMPFSFKKILKREHSTFMTLITGFTLVHYGGDFLSNLSIDTGAFWLYVFIISFVIYWTLRMLKKKTDILNTARS